MLSYDGSVKIVDFGIAKAAARSETTRAGVLKGKFGYMSPEQALGMKLDRRTDIFALGIILFELLTQRRLFTSDDDMKTLQLVKDCRVPRPSKYNPNVNANLDRIVMKVLSKEKSERYAAAGELYADLIRFMNQKYPKFIPTDFSAFLKNVFSEDIVEEKKRREKMNAEAPAVMAPIASRKNNDFAAAKARGATDENIGDMTQVDGEELTQISNAIEDPFKNKMPLSPAPNTVLDASSDMELPMSKALELKDIQQTQSAPVPMPERARSLQLETSSAQLAPTSTFQGGTHTTTNYRSRPKKSSSRLMLYGVALLVLGLGFWMQQTQPRIPINGTEVVKGELPNVENPDSDPTNVVNHPPTTEVPQVIDVKPIEEQKLPPEVAVIPSVEIPARDPAVQDPVVVLERRPAKLPSNKDLKNAGAKVPGYLNLDSVPRATEVYINGKLLTTDNGVPMSTPLKQYSLPSGTHEIRLKNSTFGASWSGVVSVVPDRISNKDVVLK